jgi:tetratricopeptide (TPR) repeat protein
MDARPKLTAAEMRTVEKQLDDATDLLDKGRFDKALSLAGATLEWLRDRGASGRRVDAYRGHAHEVKAIAFAGLGALDRAIGEYGLAEEALARHPDNREALVRAIHDLAVLMVDHDLHDMAIHVLKRALEVARDVDGPYFDVIADYLDRLGTVQAEDGEGPEDLDEQLADLRRTLAKERDPAEVAVHRANLASLLLAYGPQPTHGEAQDLLVRALRHAREKRSWDKYTGVLGVLRVARHRAITIGPDVIGELTNALEATHRIGNLAWRQEVYTTVATLLTTQPVLAPLRGRMLDLALRAVAIQDTVAVRTGSTLVRAMQGLRNGDVARFLALTEAADTGDSGLFVELLESGRLQVLPANRATEAEVEDYSNLGRALARTGAVTLSAIHPLAVDGPSRLRPYFAADAVTRSDIELFEVIAAIGGPAAWWWGANIIDQRYFWATISPTLELTVGYRDLDEDALDALVAAARSVNAEGAGIESLLVRQLCASPEAEEASSLAIGEILIPPPLRAEWWDTPAPPRWPSSLVVASNFMASLPLGLIGLRSKAGRVERLLEKVVLRWAPTAPIVQAAAGHPVYPAMEYPVGVACIDADGTLGVAAATKGEFEIVLRNSAAPDRTARPATRANFARAMSEVGPSSPKIAFFTGHSDDGIAGVDAGLQLEDGLLTAEDILFGDGTIGPVPFPSHVVFSSCSSGGATGAGRGEWLGLSAACLIRGARHVVGTAWPILDLPITNKFEADLLGRLAAGADPATALRACQIERLASWRASDFTVPPGRTVSIPADLELPLVWASFQIIGVY